MKNNRLLILIIISIQTFCYCKFQNTPSTKTSNVTFQVCDVDKATSQFYARRNPVKKYGDVIIDKTVTERNQKERNFAIQNDTTLSQQQKKDLLKDSTYQPEGIPVRKIEAVAKKEITLIQTNFHPFVATMHIAYAKHYPMTISPDMIWLLIAQGFANHVNQNPEKMRSYFVDFEGKKLLNINRDNFIKGNENNDWQGTFKEFSEQIESNTGTELLDLVTGSFSTTGPTEKAAFQVTLMDAMKSYFTYSVTTICGIPEITLEGTTEDWKLIEAKAQELAQYDLEWWIDDLLPILQEFTKASSGNPDIDFWQSIYKWKVRGSGSPYITGWVLKFFPYLDKGGKLVQFKGRKSKDKGNEINYDLSATTDVLTSGLSQADFLWNYFGTFYKMEFIAGFVGCQQDAKTLSLRPEISWAVIDKQMKPTAEEIENYKSGGDKEYLESSKQHIHAHQYLQRKNTPATRPDP